MDELPSLWIRCAAAYVQNSTDPPLGVAVSLEHIDGQPVFRIDVPLAAPGPVATKDGYYTKRVLDTLGQPQCVPMSPQEIVSMGMITRGQDYAAAVAVGATQSDLDPAEFDRYRRLSTLTRDSTAKLQDEDILRALGLVPLAAPVSLLQQERMIADYVDAFGSITSAQAAALCQVSPAQARGVLKRMVDRGDLRLVGERRGAKYVRA